MGKRGKGGRGRKKKSGLTKHDEEENTTTLNSVESDDALKKAEKQAELRELYKRQVKKLSWNQAFREDPKIIDRMKKADKPPEAYRQKTVWDTIHDCKMTSMISEST